MTDRTRLVGDYDLLAKLGSMQAINAQTASYTATIEDRGSAVTMSVGSANNFTVPPEADVAWPVGTVITVIQIGAGATTIVAGSGVTVNVDATFTRVLAGQYSVAKLIKYGTNTWVLTGDLVAA